MNFFLPTRLQTLFWEIKNRFIYVLISFFLSFAISYQNATSLLYLFVLSYKKINESPSFTDAPIEQKLYNVNYNKDVQRGVHDTCFDESFDWLLGTMPQGGNEINDISLSSLLYFSKILKDIEIASISFIFTGVEEAFSSTILICAIFSFLIIVPILVYESFSFLIPSLYIFEKQKWLFRIVGIVILWYFFLYNVQKSLIPKLSDFLLKFQISSFGFSIIGLPKIDSYCAWAITIFIGTSLIFFFFCLLSFCVINQKIQIEYFTRRRKISRAIILLLSALIAPPEIQLILALVALFFFELAIYFFFFYKNFYKNKTTWRSEIANEKH